MKKRIVLTASLLTLGILSFAQDHTHTIDHQFDQLLQESNNWQSYKVVQKGRLEQLQRNVRDSIDKLQTSITSNNAFLMDQRASIDSLSNQLQVTQNELSEALERENSFEVLGIATHKTTFTTIVGTIIGILIIALGVLFVRFKKSHVDTKNAQKKWEETELELEELRKRSLEREQKIRRQLQDEINKNKKTQQL